MDGVGRWWSASSVVVVRGQMVGHAMASSMAVIVSGRGLVMVMGINVPAKVGHLCRNRLMNDRQL